jgi:8-oxo-dGTP pyrophosphatase MutT (NUDIX family)
LTDHLSFAGVAARLEEFPQRLPEPPAELMPVRLGEAAWPSWPGSIADARPAAVLVLIVPGADGSADVILIERTTGGSHHSGEVSFPGGRSEDGDADLVATAIREAEEEIGLDVVAADMTVVGTIEPFWIPVSNYSVTAVVAIARRRPVLRASPDEVAAIVEAPLAAFVPPAPVEIVERDFPEWRVRYGGYRIGELHVWGATARILGQLGAFLGGLV